MFPINRCRCCKHYVVYPREDMRGCPYCDAFPKGIPFDIFTEKVKHDKPYPGDHGIQYEPAHLEAE